MRSPTPIKLNKRFPLPSEDTLREEFTTQSAIDLDLFYVNCKIIRDVEIENGEVIGTPIHEALNWGNRPRFTHNVRNMIAVEIRDHHQKVYQLKVYESKYLGIKGQYYALNDCGDIIYLANVPQWLCDQIAAKYKLEPPKACDFWKWVERHPEIHITITEGVKKALAGLSAGEVTVGLFGCRCGVDKATGKVIEQLIPLVKDRDRVNIAFDSDTKPKAIEAVKQGLAKLCPALKRSGANNVYVVKWNPELGKGIDDLLKNNPAYFQEALDNAVVFSAFETLKTAPGPAAPAPAAAAPPTAWAWACPPPGHPT